MSKKVLVPIADGTEELEAVTIIDVLRRAGAEVTVASVDTLQVTAAHGTKLVADALIVPCVHEIYDLVVLPGGMPGAERLRDSHALKEILREQAEEGRAYAAVCASPAVVLAHHGLLAGRRATCYPAFEELLTTAKASVEDADVVEDGPCITSRGPGTALAFALKLVERLFGRAKAREVADGMLVK